MKKTICLSTILTIFALASCNSDYDLNTLDKEMTLFGEDGIEIPFPKTDPVVLDIFSINQISESLLDLDAECVAKGIDMSDVDSKLLNDGIPLEGEFKFDLSVFPESYSADGTEILFDDISCFSILLDNSVYIPLTLSFDVYDGTKDKFIGNFNNVEVPEGTDREIKIPFNEVDMSCLPTQIVIKNIVLKSTTSISGTISGIIDFVSANCKFNPIVMKGSKLVYEYEFTDFFHQLGINIEDLTEHFDTKSFIIKDILKTNLPLQLLGEANGEVTVKLLIEGPTNENGSLAYIDVKCLKGLSAINVVKMKITCTTSNDIDMLHLDDLHIEMEPMSIQLDKGIIVKP